MDCRMVKDAIIEISRYIPFVFPATGWYYAPARPDNGMIPARDGWSCIFSFFSRIAVGEKLYLSANNPGCSGAACYLGFKKPGTEAGKFLAEKEKFKKNAGLGKAFYTEIKALAAKDRFIVLSRIEDLEDSIAPEVVTLWVEASSLSGLVTLANYDKASNNNVVIPFASGCQSIWTIPYKEKSKKSPKAVIGLVDPAARAFFPPEVLSFSMPVDRFLEMASNVPGSFLETELWKSLTGGEGHG